jgi:hypothetical protein
MVCQFLHLDPPSDIGRRGSGMQPGPQDIAILRIMSFLDNLENNLKAMESRTERDPAALAREASAREAARTAALEIAPYADALRNGPFKDGLLTACREIGHRRRILVRPVWVDSTLRLETGSKRLELRPSPGGVLAVSFVDGRELESTPIDLTSDPAKIAEKWLAAGDAIPQTPDI